LVKACPTADETFQAAQSALQQIGLTYPFIAKPDQGERGSGVQVIRCEESQRLYCEESTGIPFLVQEYAPGPEEWGVFYIRLPSEKKGYIFSITIKEPTCVCGDGVSTLRSLILNDPRARYMARVFLMRHHEHLDDIIPANERVKLVEAGNHCQGTIFR